MKKDIVTNKTPLSIVISFVGSWTYGHHKIENEVNFPTFSREPHKIEKVHHPKKIIGHDIYCATLAASTLIVLFSEMLKFSP